MTTRRSFWKGFALTFGMLAGVGVALAATFNLFQPANGILKGNPSTYITTAATSADVVATFSGTCDATTALRGDGSCGSIPAGTVTSVGLTMPSGFSVGGSPVTTSGTLAVTTTLNGPLRGNGSGLITGSTSLTTEVSGTLPVANGGTGVATLANDSLLMGNGTSAMSAKAVPSCSGASDALTYNVTTDTWGCNTIAGGGGSVTSITAGTGISASPSSPITSSGTLSVDQAFSPTWSGTHTFSNAPVMNAGAMLSGGLFSSSFKDAAFGRANMTGCTLSVSGRGTLCVDGSTDSGIEFLTAGSSAGYMYTSSSEFRMFANTSRDLNFYSNAAQRLSIDTDGSWDLAGTTPGTSGQVLTSNGSASAPTWQTPLSSGRVAWVGNTGGSGSCTTATANSSGFSSCTRNTTGSWTFTLSPSMNAHAVCVASNTQNAAVIMAASGAAGSSVAVNAFDAAGAAIDILFGLYCISSP
jgi:hypothetical protein